jgi:hypothetical protein
MKLLYGVMASACLFALGCDSGWRNLVSDPVDPWVDATPGPPDAAPPLPDATQPAIDAAPPDAAADSAADASAPAARCGKQACKCDDGVDNDLDGLADGLDPECTGAFDQDEASFATGAKVAQKSCRDCYWDSNSGSGDDSCRYPEACLRGAALSGNGACQSCEVTESCVSSCAARTPNGCDCFGCCGVALGAGTMVYLELSDTCSLAKLSDVNACPRCVQNTACLNPCGRCELCPGRRLADLPPDCGDGKDPSAPAYRCDEGQPICRTTADCQADMYCQLGCCLAALL